jgi:REP element-mobilizing transposase RayT
LADAIDAARKKFEFQLWAYVFMPNHAHLVVFPSRERDDIAAMNPVRRGLAQSATDWKWSSARWFAGRKGTLLLPDPIPLDWLD